MNRNMLIRQFLQRQIPRQNDQPKQKPNIPLKQWLTGSRPNNPRYLKQHILNFFISEGLYDIGVQFSKEAGIPMPSIQEQQVKARYHVKRLIQEGKVDESLYQLSKFKLKNKKIKPNEEIIVSNLHKKGQQIQQQGIQLQEIKVIKETKLQQDKTQKLQQKQLIVQEQANQEEKAKLQNIQQPLKSDAPKNQQQRPLLAQLFEEQPSPHSSSQLKHSKEESEKQQQSRQPQINSKQKQKQDGKVNQKKKQQKQEKRMIHPIFEKGNNSQLLFTLNCLKVIQLIRKNQIQESIKVAKYQLLPLAKNKKQDQADQTLNEEFMQKIEKVMSLIAFANFQDSPNYPLTTREFRAKVAHQLNVHLLNDENTESITALIRLTKWCQKRLKKYVQFPELNMSSATLYD